MQESVMVIKTSQGNIVFIYKIRSLTWLELFKQPAITSMQVGDGLSQILFGKRHF